MKTHKDDQPFWFNVYRDEDHLNGVWLRSREACEEIARQIAVAPAYRICVKPKAKP